MTFELSKTQYKKDALKSYNKNMKDLIFPYLKEKRFSKYKSNSFVKINKNDLLEIINFQKEASGSLKFTVNYAIMPLYFKTNYLILSMGNRLGFLKYSKDYWWNFENNEKAFKSFCEVKNIIKEKVIPWFENFNNIDFCIDFIKDGNTDNRLQKDSRLLCLCYLYAKMRLYDKSKEAIETLKKENSIYSEKIIIKNLNDALSYDNKEIDKIIFETENESLNLLKIKK